MDRSSTSSPRRAVGAADLNDGELRAVQAGGRSWVIARVGDDRFACENRCPHYGIRLSNGRLFGDVLECRWHHWRFDLRSGMIDSEESRLESFETFDVTVDGSDLVIAADPKSRVRRKPATEAVTVAADHEGAL